MLQRVYKNISVSQTPYIFETEAPQTTEDAEESLKKKKRSLDEFIMQSELRLKQQEENIIRSARAQAAQITKEAENQGEILKQQQSRDGFSAGLNIAAEQYCRQYAELEKYKQQLDEKCDRRIEMVENQIVDVALVLAKKIIDVEIDRNDEAIQSVIKGALDKVKDDKELALELSQANAERIDEMAVKHNFKVKANESFGIDDLMLHSEHGTIDMSIRNQFENLKNDLLDQLK